MSRPRATKSQASEHKHTACGIMSLCLDETISYLSNAPSRRDAISLTHFKHPRHNELKVWKAELWYPKCPPRSTTAEKEEMLTEETALLHDDRAYLKDLTGQCEERAKEWDQRTTARAGELTAVSKALEILGGTVSRRTEMGFRSRTDLLRREG